MCTAWCGWRVRSRQGRLGAAEFGSAGMVRRSVVRCRRVRLGTAKFGCYGTAGHLRGSAAVLWPVMFRLGQAKQGQAWLAWRGWVRMAGQPTTRHGWQGRVRFGQFRSGLVGSGAAGLG